MKTYLKVKSNLHWGKNGVFVSLRGLHVEAISNLRSIEIGVLIPNQKRFSSRRFGAGLARNEKNWPKFNILGREWSQKLYTPLGETGVQVSANRSCVKS